MSVYNPITQSWNVSIGKNGTDTLFLSTLINYPVAVKYGISNLPNSQQLANLQAVIDNIYEVCTSYFGILIPVLPSFISTELNTVLMADPSSQSFSGTCINMNLSSLNRNKTNADLFNFIKNNVQFDKLIWNFGDNNDPQFVNTSYNSISQSGQILRLRNINSNYEVIGFTPVLFNGFTS